MTTALTPPAPSGRRALRIAVTAWFGTAMLGQWLFASYIALFYWGTGLRGEFAKWNTVLFNGIMPGDSAGNVAVAIHVLLAFFMILAGPLQLMPMVRNRWPRFHRWVGRSYVVLAFVISGTGLYLDAARDNIGGTILEMSVALNGLVTMACAVLAWRYALAKRFLTHRDWAIRLWLSASGVWFFRVGMMFWVLVNQGPVGLGDELDGPAAIGLAYGSWLLPLGVFELYRRARDGGGALFRGAVALLIGALALATLAGTGMAAFAMWWPRIGG
ncbi:MAG: DUF2306 domain-containing protein [Sphingopyxis sp.]